MSLLPSGLVTSALVARGMPLLYEHGYAGESARIGRVSGLHWTQPEGPGGLQKLRFTATLPPPGISLEADRVALRMGAGIVSSVSIGFDILGARSSTSQEKRDQRARGENIDFWTNAKGRETVTKFSVHEISLVSLGADQEANLDPVAVTSAAASARADASSFEIERLTHARTHGPEATAAYDELHGILCGSPAPITSSAADLDRAILEFLS